MSLKNLKKETINFLNSHNKTLKDIEWIGSFDGDIKIELEDFLKAANKEYDSGFGSNEVNSSLVIVGKDWWMTRWEYDGSEGWEFHIKPVLNKNYKIGTNVFVQHYKDFWEIIDNLTFIEREAKNKNLI